MKVVEKKITDIRPYDKNPRINEDAVDFVAQSIKDFGFRVPINVDANNVIITGHTRYKAAIQLGLKTVPCVVCNDLTEEQVRAYRLADNKVSEFALWDEALLNAELAEIENINMEDLGFDLSFDEEDIVDDEYEAVVPEEPISKVGEIYQLGRHRLMCGDSTSLEMVQKLMDGKQADLLLTDPPYNVDYEGKTKDKLKIENDKMGNDDFREFLCNAFKNADAVMKPGGAFYIWHADSEGYNFRGACYDTGWNVRQCLIWQKNSMVMGRQDYQWKHEPCLYGWKDGAAHNWESDRKQTTILEFDRPTKSVLHPTMKPIPLFDYQIKNNTKPGEIVLDLFGGSGTSIMACEQNGRTCYTMEFDPKYVDVIIARWEELTGEKAEKVAE